jgi:hypothetical protein
VPPPQLGDGGSATNPVVIPDGKAPMLSVPSPKLGDTGSATNPIELSHPNPAAGKKGASRASRSGDDSNAESSAVDVSGCAHWVANLIDAQHEDPAHWRSVIVDALAFVKKEDEERLVQYTRS